MPRIITCGTISLYENNSIPFNAKHMHIISLSIFFSKCLLYQKYPPRGYLKNAHPQSLCTEMVIKYLCCRAQFSQVKCPFDDYDPCGLLSIFRIVYSTPWYISSNAILQILQLFILHLYLKILFLKT